MSTTTVIAGTPLAGRTAAAGGTALPLALDGGAADLITTSSIAATRVLEKFSVYSGTKAYLSQLTRLLRVELGRKRVRVATVEPGMVDTELPNQSPTRTPPRSWPTSSRRSTSCARPTSPRPSRSSHRCRGT